MTDTDVDKVYIKRIKPRLIRGTPTEDIRRWSVLAHSVMEVTGPSLFGEDGNVLLWLHKKSLTQLLDMCDTVDERFSEVGQAELGNGTCEQVITDCDDGLMPPFTAHCSKCGAEWGFTPKFCPECGAKVVGMCKRQQTNDKKS